MKKLVLGRRTDLGWRTESVVTCHTSRKVRVCGSCGREIPRGEKYYAERNYFCSREKALLWHDACPSRRTLCRDCWRGKELDPEGSLVVFADLSKPRGERVAGIKPLPSRFSQEEEGRRENPAKGALGCPRGTPKPPFSCRKRRDPSHSRIAGGEGEGFRLRGEETPA